MTDEKLTNMFFKYVYIVAVDVMRGSFSGCFRRNLKAWISLVILAQCMLVLVYLDVTKSVNSPGFLSLVRRSVFGGPDLVATEPRPIHHTISTGIGDHLVERPGHRSITDDWSQNGTRESKDVHNVPVKSIQRNVNNIRVKSNQKDSFQTHRVVSNIEEVRHIPNSNNRARGKGSYRIFTLSSHDYETTTLFPRVIPKNKLKLKHGLSAKENNEKKSRHSSEYIISKQDEVKAKATFDDTPNDKQIKHSANVILEDRGTIPNVKKSIWDTHSQKKLPYVTSKLSDNPVPQDNVKRAESVVANLPWKYRLPHQAGANLADILQTNQIRDVVQPNANQREHLLSDKETQQSKHQSINNKPPLHKSESTSFRAQGQLDTFQLKNDKNREQKQGTYGDNTIVLNRAIYNATLKLVKETSSKNTRTNNVASMAFGKAQENRDFKQKGQYELPQKSLYPTQFKQQVVHERAFPRQEMPRRQNIPQSDIKPNAAAPPIGVHQVQIQVFNNPTRHDKRTRMDSAIKTVNGTNYRIQVLHPQDSHPQDSSKQVPQILPQRRVQGVSNRHNRSKVGKQDTKYNSDLKNSNSLYNITIKNEAGRYGVKATAASNSKLAVDIPNKVVDFLKPTVFQLPNPQSTRDYFLPLGDHGCYEEGTATVEKNGANSSTAYSHAYCRCKPEWHGSNCSLPDIFYYSTASGFMHSVRPRSSFRRVINALAFNVEFDLLEARFYELSDVVDVFIVFESNFSNFGEPKPLRLLERLQKGYLKEFHHKIVYIMRDYFPRGGKENGWLVDEHMRTFIGREGLSRLANTKPDDLFIYTDADEFPSRDALQFLRLHDGYPEPFGLSLRWSVFGFFWKQYEPTRIYVGCTLSMMRYVFQYSAFELRAGDYFTKHAALIQAYVTSGGNVYEWHLGENGFPAGWHCSWCMPPEGIKIKLQSAINADFPRWGDYPHKLQLDYIRQLVKNGVWFDDEMKFDSLVSPATDSFYAPNYMLANFDRYKKLLHHSGN